MRRRRRWAAWRGRAWTSSCDHAVTSSAVLCRSFGVVPQLQFIDSVDGVRDGVLLVLPSVVHRDRYPQCFPFDRVWGVAVHWQGRRCWGRGCSMEACERITHFFYVLALFAWNLDLISLSPLFWQPLAHGSFWTNFFYFLREKWTLSSPRSSHPGNLNIIFYERYLAVPRASVYIALKEFHIFSS